MWDQSSLSVNLGKINLPAVPTLKIDVNTRSNTVSFLYIFHEISPSFLGIFTEISQVLVSWKCEQNCSYVNYTIINDGNGRNLTSQKNETVTRPLSDFKTCQLYNADAR